MNMNMNMNTRLPKTSNTLTGIRMGSSHSYTIQNSQSTNNSYVVHIVKKSTHRVGVGVAVCRTDMMTKPC
jgi:hypothetical protein